jgi:hypothetical protein
LKALKWVGVVLGVYVGVVFAFEGLYLGWYQPKLENMPIPMLVITTTDDSGESHTRRLAQLDVDGKIYVSAHHWPRAWYRRAEENPDVRVEIDGVESDFVAVPVKGAEFERVAAAAPLPLPIRFLMGFPPQREIMRLDPAT